MATSSDSGNQNAAVVAIDLGTCFVRYALSMQRGGTIDKELSDEIGSLNPESITLFRELPAIILFNSDLKFDSFGYEAEEKYMELIALNHQHAWYYFKRFKTELLKSKSVSRGVKIMDVNGRYIPARFVFSETFRYIKSCVTSEAGHICRMENNTKWVIGVPFDCNKELKEFIREAAVLAGYRSEDITLIDEVDVLFTYCKSLPEPFLCRSDKPEKTSGNDRSNCVIVLSLGGGSSNLIVYEVGLSGEEISPTLRLMSCDILSVAGTQIDTAFLDLMLNIFPPDVWLNFKANHPYDYTEIFTEFETLKLANNADLKDYISIEIPNSLIDILRKDKQMHLRDLVSKTSFEAKFININANYIEIKKERFERFFQDSCDSIIKHLKFLFRNENQRQACSNIIMTGGFSNSTILQSLLRNAFPGHEVLVVPMPECATVEGCLLQNQRKYGSLNYVTYSNARMIRRANPFIKEEKTISISETSKIEGLKNEQLTRTVQLKLYQLKLEAHSVKIPKQLEIYAVLDIGSTYSGCAYALNFECSNECLPVMTTVKWIGGNDIFWPKTPTTLHLKAINVKTDVAQTENENKSSLTTKHSKGKRLEKVPKHAVRFDEHDDYYDVLEIDDETHRYNSARTPSDESGDSDSAPEADRDIITPVHELNLTERGNLKLDTENYLFGFEAEDEHYKFEDANTYRYFPKFLTQVKTLTEETKVKDSCGADMLVSELITLVIKALKIKIEHIIMFNKRLPVRKTNFKWILTVPSVWNDEALEVMAMAVKKAGITENQFRLVPDMKAISMYCNAAFQDDVQSISTNEDVLILDLGGGHIDTSVLVCNAGKRHLVCAREEIGGDALIEAGVQKYLEKEFGRKTLKQICKSSEYLRTLRSFSKTLDSVARINSTPRIYAPFLVRQLNAQTDKHLIQNLEFENIFYEYVDQIIEHMEGLLNNNTGEERKIGLIFIVGGLSVTHRQIKEGLSDAINETRVCIPADAVTCAMIGGLMCCYRDEFLSYDVIRSESVPELENSDVAVDRNESALREPRHRPPPSYSSADRRSAQQRSRRGNRHSATSRTNSLDSTPSFDEPPSYSSIGYASGMKEVNNKQVQSLPSQHDGHGAFASEKPYKKTSDEVNELFSHPYMHRLSIHSLHNEQNAPVDSLCSASPQIRQRSRVHPGNVHRTASQSMPRDRVNQSHVPDNSQSSCCLIL